jgi:hypothetical protein
MSISVQFSYPAMPYTASNNNPGFFTYTNSSTSTYVSFKPSEFIVANKKLYIKHIGPSKDSNIYVVFNLEEDNKSAIKDNKSANPIIDTNGNINLNSLISDELERKSNSKFKLTNNVNYKYSGTASTFSSGTHVFEIAGTIRVTELRNILSLPNLGTLNDSTQNIKLTPSSFATDDIICDTGEVSKTAAQEYSTKVAGNIGLNIGVGLFVILAVVGICLALHKYSGLVFNRGVPLLGGWDTMPQKAYAFFIFAFFIISFSCFIAYGVRMGKGGNKTNIVTAELTSALLFFVLPFVMLWLKANVLLREEPQIQANP